MRGNLAKEITKAPNPTPSGKHILQKIKGEKLYNQLSSHIINTDNKCTRSQTKPIASNFKDFICFNKDNQYVITIILLGQTQIQMVKISEQRYKCQIRSDQMPKHIDLNICNQKKKKKKNL